MPITKNLISIASYQSLAFIEHIIALNHLKFGTKTDSLSYCQKSITTKEKKTSNSKFVEYFIHFLALKTSFDACIKPDSKCDDNIFNVDGQKINQMMWMSYTDNSLNVINLNRKSCFSKTMFLRIIVYVNIL